MKDLNRRPRVIPVGTKEKKKNPTCFLCTEWGPEEVTVRELGILKANWCSDETGLKTETGGKKGMGVQSRNTSNKSPITTKIGKTLEWGGSTGWGRKAEKIKTPRGDLSLRQKERKSFRRPIQKDKWKVKVGERGKQMVTWLSQIKKMIS